MKVKQIGFANKVDTGFRKKGGVKSTPRTVIRATGRMRLPLLSCGRLGEERVWEEIKKCILDILHLKRQLDIQTEKLSRQLDQ